ncbi:TonB-dependent receptor [Maridesulfovibrio sp.]|uniref:TonB-dependent receptor n=1 Tax=Maridesulfovibrio sp. TaxID=2795000 RepID=UPI003BAD957C
MRNGVLCRQVSLFAAILLFTWVSSAHAEHGRSVQLDAVTVTAQKKEENVQDIPSSISVIPATEVEDARLLSIKDLTDRIPNMSIFSPGMDMINLTTIRGATSDPHNNISAVALYIDGIPVTSNLGYVAQLYDIERVEVLRGPQGTLYGRNSEGGVINIVTRKPDDSLKAKATLEGGTREMARVQAALSGPLLEDTLYLGGAGQIYQKNGWVKNINDGEEIDDKKNYSGQATMRYTPTKDLEMSLFASMQKFDEGTFGMYPYPTDTPRQVDTDTPGYNRSAIDQQALTVNYDLNDAWKLTSVTSRRYTDADYLIDYDFSTMPMQETYKNDKYLDLSQEIRANYESDNFSMVLGVMGDYYDRKVQYQMPNLNMAHYAKDETCTYASFGQLTIPFAERWAFTAGMRVDYYTTDFKDIIGYKDSDSWFTYSPKVALEYSLTDTNNLYTSLSRGFRAAGYNAYTPPNGKNKFDEESIWSLEFGSKNTFLDGTAKLNAAVFINRKIDTQIEQYVQTGGPPMPCIDNVGDTTAYGAELEGSYELMHGWEAFGSFGYTYVRFGDFTDALGDHKGNRLPYVPDYTYSLGSQYRHDSGFMIRVKLSGLPKSIWTARTMAISRLTPQ